MDREFKLFLFTSLLFHCLLIMAAWHFSHMQKVSFKNNENKILKIALTRKPPRITQYARSNLGAPSAQTGLSDRIEQQISIPQKQAPDTNGTALPSYQYKETSYKRISNAKKNVNVFQEEDIFDPKWDINDTNREGITFTEGSYRGLASYDKEELKALNYLSDSEITLILTVSSDGIVVHAEIEKSSGDLDKDRELLRIISSWHFEKGETSQTAIVQLKYFFK